MIDRTTHSQLRVSTDAGGNSYIRLPYSQVDEVRRALDKRGIRYSVDENIISLSGSPFMAMVRLGRGVDVNAIQAILDSVP
jgi:hypothetical protein